MFLVIVIAGVIEASTPGGMDEESADAAMVGFAIFALMSAELVALGLGIAGLLQKERKKIFAIFGVVFSAGTIVLTILLMMLGLAMG